MKSLINRILDSDALILLILIIVTLPLFIRYSREREHMEMNIGSEIIKGRDTTYIVGFSVTGKCYTLSDGTIEKSDKVNKLIKKDKWKE